MLDLANNNQLRFSQQLIDSVHNDKGASIIKDINSLYIAGSPLITKLLGYSKKSLEGISDYEICCDAVEFADDFIAQDQHVIATGQTYRYLSICNYNSRKSIHIAEKKLLTRQDNTPIGTIGHIEELASEKSFIFIKTLLNSPFVSHKKNNQLILSFSEPQTYPKLSDRQKELLFLVLRGRSAKEAARILSLSPRTIESYIEQLKNVFQCENKSQLIDKAYHYGWHTYVPPGIMKKYNSF